MPSSGSTPILGRIIFVEEWNDGLGGFGPPSPAVIVSVVSSTAVNLTMFCADGTTRALTWVPFIGAGETPPNATYCYDPTA